ncbi:MAG: endonuclease [Bacteroidetes bacterium]|nr:endonuclease [Bacteroidota bacterium]
MLVQANQNDVNAIRSNYPLGEVVGTPTYTYLGCKLGPDANGKTVFEPRDSDKGDAARCILYQTICYTGVAYSGSPNTNATYGGSWSLPLTINAHVNLPTRSKCVKSLALPRCLTILKLHVMIMLIHCKEIVIHLLIVLNMYVTSILAQ